MLGEKFWREENLVETKFDGNGGNLVWRMVENLFFGGNQIWQISRKLNMINASLSKNDMYFT